MSQLYQMQLGAVTYIGPAHDLGRFFAADKGLTIISLQAQGGQRRAAFYCQRDNAWREVGTFTDKGSEEGNLKAAFELFFLENVLKSGLATEFNGDTTIYRLLTDDDGTEPTGETTEPSEGETDGTDGDPSDPPSEGEPTPGA